MPDTMELQDMKKMTIDEKQWELFRLHAANIKTEVNAVIASIKNAKTIEELNKPVEFCTNTKTYIQEIDESPIGLIKEYHREKWEDANEEYKGLVGPAKEAIKEIMLKVTAKRAELKAKLLADEAKRNAKLEAKAVEKKELKVQTLMDLGKTQAAMIEAKKPLVYTPIKLEMPQIKDAVWKPTYIVEIEDIGALLTYIAKTPAYHNLIEQKDLASRLGTLARTLRGNMGEFKGIKCFTNEKPALGGGK